METQTAPGTDSHREFNDVVAGLEEKYERLPIGWFIPSKTNPRTHFDVGALEQLSGSIREKGIIEPLIVRPTKKAEVFEIVAGERRFRAGMRAGLTHLPVIIRAYTNEQALECQLEENIHRNDLSPLEAAAGYRALIKANPDKHNVQSIAERIGMSATHVWDVLKLLDLIPEAKAFLEQDRISVGHAIPIARLSPADQKRVVHFQNGGLWTHDYALEFDEDDATKGAPADRFKPRSIRELKEWIANHVRFDVEKAAKAAPLEFGPVLEQVEAAETIAEETGRRQAYVAITYDQQTKPDTVDKHEKTYVVTAWRRADGLEKSKTCEHAILGVVKSGRRAGHAFNVCVNRDKCKVHFGPEIASREKHAKQREKAAKGTPAKPKANSAQQRQQAENDKWEAENAAWLANLPALRVAVAKHLQAVKFNAKTLGIIDHHLFPGYMDLSTVKDVAHEFEVKLSDDTAAQVLALMSISIQNEHSANVTLTPWGFPLARFKAERKDAKPVAKKKGGKK